MDISSMLKGTRIVVVDLETTSASVKTAHVREFGAAEFVDGVYVRGNSALFSGGVCDPRAEQVHGISDKMVAGKPTFSSKAKATSAFLSKSILMGHNVCAFDVPIIRRVLFEQGMEIMGEDEQGKIRVIDTLLDARKYLHAPSNRLEDLCAMFGIEHGKHRALGDCMSCWNVFVKIIEMTGIRDINAFIRVI